MKKTSILVVLFFLPLITFAGGGGSGAGNGGDVVRSHFLERGQLMVDFLKNTIAGNTFCKDWDINPIFINQILTTSKIKAINGPLFDNQGDRVDARGEKGLIVLDRLEWKDYVTHGYDLDKLIFHEMLRATGYDDDEYVISAPFNKVFKPALSEDSLRVAERYEYLLVGIERDIRRPYSRLVHDEELDTYVVEGDPLFSDIPVCTNTLNKFLDRVSDYTLIETCETLATFEFMACVANMSELDRISDHTIIKKCQERFGGIERFKVTATITVDFPMVDKYYDLDLHESEEWYVHAYLQSGSMRKKLGRLKVSKRKAQTLTYVAEVDLNEDLLLNSEFMIRLEEAETGFFDPADWMIVGEFTLRNGTYSNEVSQVVIDRVERVKQKTIAIID